MEYFEKISYWVEADKLLAGEYPYNPGSKNPLEYLDSLINNGVQVFINLTEEDELTHYQNLLAEFLPNQIEHFRFEIPDYSVPTKAEMKSILNLIDQKIAEGKKVYIHCYAGIGRTGTVVGCWLSRHGHPGKEALAELKQRWQKNDLRQWVSSPETEEQKAFVTSWSE